MEFAVAEDGKHVEIRCPHMGGAWAMLPLGGDGWTVTSVDPLTVAESIHNQPCGCHGWIRDGEWVAV